MNKILGITFIFIASIAMKGFAQEDECAFKLREAEKLYQQGLIEEIPELIGNCLENGFSKEDKLQAYKLLILTYLFEDEVQNAETAMYNFIKKYPEYEITPTDPQDFVYLYESYKAIPIVSIGAVMGGTFSIANIKEPYGTNDLNRELGSYNQSGMALQFGLKFNVFVYDNIEFNSEILYTQNKFEFYDENFLGIHTLSFDETQTRLDIPLSITYDFDLKIKIKPFVRCGMNVGFLLTDYVLASDLYNDKSLEAITGADFDVLHQRKSTNYWGIIGTGVKYKIARGYLIYDMQYNIGLSNQVVPDKRYSNPDELFYYKYISNDFVLSNFNMRIGYVYSFYKPTKK
ncbi:MAG: outer membrane beta-barrel protein [Bacteroidales bacterium]|nr:outer membrane beta-barrel protein [Bacteroidales bacterium]